MKFKNKTKRKTVTLSVSGETWKEERLEPDGHLELWGGVQPAQVLVEPLLVLHLAHSVIHPLDDRSTTRLSTMEGGQVWRSGWRRRKRKGEDGGEGGGRGGEGGVGGRELGEGGEGGGGGRGGGDKTGEEEEEGREGGG